MEEGIIKKRWWHTKAGRVLHIKLTLHISPANEVFLYTSLPMTLEILSLRPKMPFNSLFSERRNYKEHGEIESLQS
jgi:hypothetical protein